MATRVARDREGKSLASHAGIYDQIYQSFYESTLALYVGQYPLFGDPEVLPVKVIWDYTYYWGILAQFFFHDRIADLGALSALREELAVCQRLNEEVQALLRQWSAAANPISQILQNADIGWTAARGPIANPAQMLDQAALPWFAELNRSLTDTLDDAAFRDRIRSGARQMQRLAAEIAERARRSRGVGAGSLAPRCAGEAPLLFAEA